MKERIHAAVVLAGRRIFETLIGVGFYVAASTGMLLAYLLVSGFVRCLDSSGFDYTLRPVYDIIGRGLVGAFGAAFVNKLFAEGPFLFVLYIGLLPVLLHLAVGSVFRFGLEKRVGAVELVSFGPSDGTSYCVAFFARNVLMTLLYLGLLLAFLVLIAAVYNLALSPSFFHNLAMVFFLSVVIYAYGVLASTLARNPASAVALFLGLMLLFLVILMGTFTVVSGYVRSLVGVFAWVVQWISPLFYWSLGLRALETGGLGLSLASILLMLAVSAAVLLASHFAMKAKGVRP